MASSTIWNRGWRRDRTKKKLSVHWNGSLTIGVGFAYKQTNHLSSYFCCFALHSRNPSIGDAKKYRYRKTVGERIQWHVPHSIIFQCDEIVHSFVACRMHICSSLRTTFSIESTTSTHRYDLRAFATVRVVIVYRYLKFKCLIGIDRVFFSCVCSSYNVRFFCRIVFVHCLHETFLGGIFFFFGNNIEYEFGSKWAQSLN